MVFTNEVIRFGGDDRIAVDLLSCLFVFPDVIESCKTKQGLIFQLKVVPGERSL